MPGIAALGKLFFEKNSGRKAAPMYLRRRLIARACSVANRSENNPARIEVVDRTFHRARW
jgi:hypothetical protein